VGMCGVYVKAGYIYLDNHVGGVCVVGRSFSSGLQGRESRRRARLD
jgi:hypothetical protein